MRVQSTCDFRFFLFFVCFVYGGAAQTAEPIFMVDGSNDVSSPKEGPFLGFIEKNQTFLGFEPRTIGVQNQRLAT